MKKKQTDLYILNLLIPWHKFSNSKFKASRRKSNSLRNPCPNFDRDNNRFQDATHRRAYCKNNSLELPSVMNPPRKFLNYCLALIDIVSTF